MAHFWLTAAGPNRVGIAVVAQKNGTTCPERDVVALPATIRIRLRSERQVAQATRSDLPAELWTAKRPGRGRAVSILVVKV